MGKDKEKYEYVEEEGSSKGRNIAGVVITCALLGVAGFLTWKYALDEPKNLTEVKDGLGDLFDAGREKWDEWDLGNFTNVLDDLDDFSFGDLFQNDPKEGDSTTLVWKDSFVEPGNGGLHLVLQNALDETWQGEFDAAVEDWQKSDALVLEAQQVAVDHECNRVDGVMVVCNANFGATGWVGINENSIMRGVIVSSVAKMNEYYLRNANFAHRRFTMCHELGHGFGLPHTDENPYNANLGNCLDYTDDPEENIYPGEVNMEKLRGMYLTRRRLRVEEDGTVVETTHLIRR
eukprot:CAMPEP_0172543176 /NCGR_PEP_ID=MMETSP1067-20121228/13631_1 /TAXON_ID=265564 ORGANISM="Thalassiosira punctigera, Strain Tpunct2005C2" /NCGR_SAMPLE_ID=MMETSP1067 /ASSEMBLY_ACC=CAM_ASM_000444 /LENGTH=289 /DNA_ID=CAMNT_0013329541 /DNA_START=441 /DNA_END=1310 /DNA_ORIENTATION=+